MGDFLVRLLQALIALAVIVVAAVVVGFMAAPETTSDIVKGARDRFDRGTLRAGLADTPEEQARKQAERKAAEERQREAEARSSIRSAYCSGSIEIVKINPVPDEVRKGIFGLEVGRDRHPGVNIGEGRETCDLYWAVKALPGLETCADFRSAQGSARWCAGGRGGWVRRDSRNPGLWVRSATGAHGKPALPIEICILPVRAGAQIEDPVGFVMRECNPHL